MDRNNYLCWKSQFQDILEIHDPEEVVKSDGQPDKKLADGSINPAYSKDRLVLSWIKATSSPQIKTFLIPCTTASEAWSLLDKRLSPLSKTYVCNLRDQIRTLKKESENTVAEYLMHDKSLYDSLVAAGSQMTDEELIEYILDGLGHDYRNKAHVCSCYRFKSGDRFGKVRKLASNGIMVVLIALDEKMDLEAIEKLKEVWPLT
ncbi:unnamed protein product [Prunus armeniaca]